MRKFGLIGYPLGHSYSKRYFTEKFIREQINDCLYINWPLKSLNELHTLIENDKEICGLNVTIPYKSDVIRFLDKVETQACEIGAVNVVKVKRKAGHIRLSGFNSDVTGIINTIKPFLNGNVRNALVLGTGGSSRAVCHVLSKSGLKVSIVSRSGKPGILSYHDLDSEILKESHLIVNTTPLGMYPDTESAPEINYNYLTDKHILFDLVYNPEKTTFLRKGEEKGCTIISGIKMLYSQAEKAWEIWNDENL